MTPPPVYLPPSNINSVGPIGQTDGAQATTTPKPLSRTEELNAAEAKINLLEAAPRSLDAMPLALEVVKLLAVLLPKQAAQPSSAGNVLQAAFRASQPLTTTAPASKTPAKENELNKLRGASASGPVALDRASALADKAALALIDFAKPILIYNTRPGDDVLPVAVGRSVTVGGA